MSAQQETGRTASLAELRNPNAPERNMPVIRMGFGDLQGFELMQRAAKALAGSTLIPPQFQGHLPNCIIALEMANRIGASPLMVCQNLYIVHERPAWSAKFLIASFNQCGRFTSLRYEWQGAEGKDDWGCRAWATEKATGEKIVGPLITIGLARAEGWFARKGSKWQTIPELMLTYRAAAWLVNTHAPEISMGLNTAEELGDTFDAGAGEDGQYRVTTDSLRQVEKPTVDAEVVTEAAAKRKAKAKDEAGGTGGAGATGAVQGAQDTGATGPQGATGAVDRATGEIKGGTAAQDLAGDPLPAGKGEPALPTPAVWFDRCLMANTIDQVNVLQGLITSYPAEQRAEMSAVASDRLAVLEAV
jgi:hypothetical protein